VGGRPRWGVGRKPRPAGSTAVAAEAAAEVPAASRCSGGKR
jgi:hypothetical protein